MPQEVAMREAYGKALVEMGRENPDIVALDADLSKSTMTHLFAKEFPRRFFDCGIAEQNMVGIAAGFAASGKIPFASTFAVFMLGRCFDQVRMSIVQPGLNVKLVPTHGGITVGEDGISHQAIEDLALACSLPGLTVIVPADAIEAVQAVKTAAATDGPFYIRLCRPKSPLLYDNSYRFELGKAVTMREGSDVTVIAIGLMVAEALKAADVCGHGHRIAGEEGDRQPVLGLKLGKPHGDFDAAGPLWVRHLQRLDVRLTLDRRRNNDHCSFILPLRHMNLSSKIMGPQEGVSIEQRNRIPSILLRRPYHVPETSFRIRVNGLNGMAQVFPAKSDRQHLNRNPIGFLLKNQATPDIYTRHPVLFQHHSLLS